MSNPREFQAEPNSPVVFLAGAATEPAEWTWLAEYLGGKFSVAAPDVRLDNRASTADWIAAAESAFLREAMASGGQINIVAHGVGAIPALGFAARNPGMVRGLVLIEAMALRKSSDAVEFRKMAEAFERFCSEGDAAAATGWHTDFWHGKGAWARTSAALRQSMAFRTGATRRDIEAISRAHVGEQELACVVCPVLLINGSKSATVAEATAARLSLSIPFARKAVVPEAGHMPHITDPHVTHPLVREFLVRIAQHWHDSAVPMAVAA